MQSFKLEIGTLPSENVRNVCSLSELNEAKFECKLIDDNHLCKIAELIFGFSGVLH